MAEVDQFGRIIRRTRPSLPDTHYTPTYTSSSTSLSWWNRLNNFFIDIGNWFAGHTEDITSILTLIVAGFGILGLAVWVIGVFGSEGFLLGILSIVGAYFMGYIMFIAIGIGAWILGMFLLIIRYVFWNIYTVLIAVAISLFFMVSNVNGNTNNSVLLEQHTALQTTKYYCTARSVLNIRSAPSADSNVIGTIKPNQTVEVYEIANGFAKIKHETGVAYVSLMYLKKCQN